ncbi:hypothetical protein BO94DRAFT_523159 [Aspergillus sclerotioniger CBS 115572]|uniref:Tachykinin family protein n=1 Tax=Aspergillus sclerotioniger CBS 115572 TaxID=1450535 RepID=A0A317VZG6_9EURO|nr:hypothetical protein BO94DRAFT_523159 [Aspergillus sclerotioniger CBS 115572]PWY77290.1 hypothetical protein BO94DRAFT_523159 [Aspergillus sclerotioniger CBS 115572]
MGGSPSEVVFSTVRPTAESVVFRYTNGPVKVALPQKRGRPVGSTKKRPQSEAYHEPAVTPEFEFINLGPNKTRINHTARMTIRSHTMLNRGRRKQRQAQAVDSNTVGPAFPMPKIHSRHIFPLTTLMDPFDTLPITIEPYMQDQLSFYTTSAWETLYSIEKRAGCNPIDNYWAPIAFQDAAMLHVVLACALLFAMEAYRVGTSPAFMRHTSRAMSIIRERVVCSANAPSDETLVAIASMAVAKKAAGHHDQWVADMKILKTLVDLRGGLDALDDKPLLQGKIYRADICGSIDAAQKAFFGDRFQQLPILKPQEFRLCEGFRDLVNMLHVEGTLKVAMADLQYIVEAFSNITKNSGHAIVAQVRFWVTSIQYTLLSVQYGVKCNPQSEVQEVCRLSLLLLVTTVFHEMPQGASTSDILIARLRRFLNNNATCSWLPSKFRLWAVFLARCNVLSPELRAWCTAAISGLISKMAIYDEGEFKQLLAMFPQDSSMYGTTCRIWDEVQSLVPERPGAMAHGV